MSHKTVAITQKEIRISAFSISVIIVSYNKCFVLKRAIPRLTGWSLLTNQSIPTAMKLTFALLLCLSKKKNNKRRGQSYITKIA